MPKISLPIQIIISMIAGFIFAIMHILLGWDTFFALHYMKPLGHLFINSLKALSIPFVFTGIIQGVSSLEDAKKVSKIGLKTMLLYIITTILAICLGLVIASIVRPGEKFAPVMRSKLAREHEVYQGLHKSHTVGAKAEVMPDNLLSIFSDNNNLLFIVIFAILFAIALFGISARRRKLMLDFYAGIHEVFSELIKLIMRFAPVGIFSLTSSILIEQATDQDFAGIYNFLVGIAWYTVSVVGGLSFMTFVVYPLLVLAFTQVSWRKFIKSVSQAQLVAFSTSSSSVALPTSIACAEKNLSVSSRISNFVLSLGASINMDGTVLYQAIATSFIAQAYGVDFGIEKTLTIVTYLTISSFGLGGVPGISLSTTSLLLNTLGIPAEGIVLIIMPERILDMLRTATNVTGDLFVALTIDRLEKGKSYQK